MKVPNSLQKTSLNKRKNLLCFRWNTSQFIGFYNNIPFKLTPPIISTGVSKFIGLFYYYIIYNIIYNRKSSIISLYVLLKLTKLYNYLSNIYINIYGKSYYIYINKEQLYTVI